MKISLDHALVSLDHSEASDVIVNGLSDFIQMGTKKVTLFTAVDLPYPKGLPDEEKEKYYEKQEQYKKTAEAFGFEAETDIKFSFNSFFPFHILEAANENNADFLIIGNRGHSLVHELLIGSTAIEVLQQADIPVYLMNLVLTDDKDPEDRRIQLLKEKHHPLDHILHPTDFSETSTRAFELVKMLSRNRSKKVTLIHVQSIGRLGMVEPKQIEEYDLIDRNRLDEMKSELGSTNGPEINTTIQTGSPGPEILKEMDAAKATLIIMGSQGRGYVREVFLGGVSHQVARGSNIPVLLVPAIRP